MLKSNDVRTLNVLSTGEMLMSFCFVLGQLISTDTTSFVEQVNFESQNVTYQVRVEYKASHEDRKIGIKNFQNSFIILLFFMARGCTSFNLFYFCYQDNAKHEEAQEDEADDQQPSGSGEAADEEDTFGKKSILSNLFDDT